MPLKLYYALLRWNRSNIFTMHIDLNTTNFVNMAEYEVCVLMVKHTYLA